VAATTASSSLFVFGHGSSGSTGAKPLGATSTSTGELHIAV
jgi:hypothetical protein